jgi:ABC-type antimicrobial peptide transport system permease subunit
MFFPLKDWHLYSSFKDGRPDGGLIDYVRMFATVGILVLLIACINFMNLSTARSVRRAREVGVKKLMGSLRGHLILQFLMESLLMTALAFLLALALVELTLPAFNSLTGDAIRVPFTNAGFWLSTGSCVLVTGLLAGSRPAFYLSSFQPVKVLKQTMRAGPAASLPRKILVVLQFTCSIALIISTIIIYQQIQYAKNRPSGYDPNRLIVSRFHSEDYAAFTQEMLSSGAVSSLTRSTMPQTWTESPTTIDNWPGKLPDEPLSLTMNAVADSSYFRTLGIGFVAGANFKGSSGADSTCVIINETAARQMRLKQPLNQYLELSYSNTTHRLRIIGVVKDALNGNPFAAVQAAGFLFQPDWSWMLSMRLAPMVSTPIALAKMKTIYEKYNPGYPFDYFFMDQSYASSFATEILIGRLAGVFAVLAVFISCLGLFGLTAYMAEQRTKEIGIRKVLGASVNQVLLLLSGDFIILVGISCLISAPVAYYFLHQWLAGYYYRITINPLVFVIAAVVALIITALTVGFQSVKSALMNPVRSLRNE